jgi:DNA-binding NarL/FixJ family response regulator
MNRDSDREAIASPATVALLFRTRLDCDLVSHALRPHEQFHILGSSTLLTHFRTQCRRSVPKVALIEATYPLPKGHIVDVIADLLENRRIEYALFLDILPNRGHTHQAIALPRTGYITRQRSLSDLIVALNEIVHGNLPVDWNAPPEYSHHQDDETSDGRQHNLANLTSRELDVLQLIAEGRSAAECARLLKLSAHTIENHKARLMKKLGLRKASQLTLLAVREGLIVP